MEINRLNLKSKVKNKNRNIMLPGRYRISRKKDFERAFKKGNRYDNDFLFLKIFKNNLKISRFGFIVSRKISKKANIRNKIKRQISEIIKLELPKIEKGFDIILLTKPGIEKINFKKIKENLKKILRKANLLKNDKIYNT
jgi:ribonuclease P protein component